MQQARSVHGSGRLIPLHQAMPSRAGPLIVLIGISLACDHDFAAAVGCGDQRIARGRPPERHPDFDLALLRASAALPEFFGANAEPGSSALCAGDSGAPATLLEAGEVRLLGVALSSSDDGSGSTPDGGFQLFLKLDPLASWVDM